MPSTAVPPDHDAVPRVWVKLMKLGKAVHHMPQMPHTPAFPPKVGWSPPGVRGSSSPRQAAHDWCVGNPASNHMGNKRKRQQRPLCGLESFVQFVTASVYPTILRLSGVSGTRVFQGSRLRLRCWVPWQWKPRPFHRAREPTLSSAKMQPATHSSVRLADEAGRQEDDKKDSSGQLRE
jgi:hypothetical protein